MNIRTDLTAPALLKKIEAVFSASAAKIESLERNWDPGSGSPAFTAAGRYTSRGWTEWTQGFQYGSAILQFDATDDRRYFELGRERTLAVMAPHLTNTGVH